MGIHSTEFKPTNVRPDDYNRKDYNVGDCTTRAMTYCLNGEMSYKEIEALQYRIGAEMGYRRNRMGVWDKVMTMRGYSWVQLNDLKNRAFIASCLCSISVPFISLSRGHVCAIDKGEVKDTWDSRGGRVYGILAPNEVCDEIISILFQFGVSCERVETPTHKVTPHRRRMYWHW